MSAPPGEVYARELAYHEKLYSGFAQAHFARPAVRALRAHMARKIHQAAGLSRDARVLSLGCGIGDTELLLAPQVREIVGVDLSPAAVRQARADAERLGIKNVRFEQGSEAAGLFDAVIAIFFLHHLPNSELEALPEKLMRLLAPGGAFYSLDPSRARLSGAIGRKIVPALMKKYQTPDERELDGETIAALFRRVGFDVEVDMYDFGSSPLAGLFPGWSGGYHFARRADDLLLRIPALRARGSNFEIIARLG